MDTLYKCIFQDVLTFLYEINKNSLSNMTQFWNILHNEKKFIYTFLLYNVHVCYNGY